MGGIDLISGKLFVSSVGLERGFSEMMVNLQILQSITGILKRSLKVSFLNLLEVMSGVGMRESL